ncbi:HET-domain-containing protein [Hyaloscypha variabilis F]|uniref:HET-domain-containing protein n=1 Tax=Hyaloscypha variabilis (strain UAMH 11265 / GT02V1 / F) TaxID=1149755 RepID=A0A2J6S8C4_HYAVF|nr:HET-domain-containing protein [Hyaloscypha variabilis F]
MRLINARTLKLGLFPDPVDEPYAILSHTWADDEVSFQDMQDLSFARTKKGFTKIEATCRMAIQNGLQYVWVDTCCIDKTSSAELSEAINSMFSWYKNAVVCFAFLSDFTSGGQRIVLDDLRKCRWFKRGWTLQELIAPKNLLFLDEEWNPIGTKEDLAQDIENITGIDHWVLNGYVLLRAIPLAKRMSWVAGRQTTRIEDHAYCLMGIFDVNMPMIYGEGSKAFIRLQEEILKNTTDLSLFAWEARANTGFRGILAESPAEFLQFGTVSLNYDQFCFRDEISMTNKGVKIVTRLQYIGAGTYVMDLHCYRKDGGGDPKRIGIFLRRTLDTYLRYLPHLTAPGEIVPGTPLKPIFLASTADELLKRSMVDERPSRRIWFEFPKDTLPCRVHNIKAVPETYWDANEKFFSTHDFSRFRCFLRFSVTSPISPLNSKQGTSSEDTRHIILVCDYLSASRLHISLYTEASLQNSPKPEEFIDPFDSIEQYGPLGDPFSLSILCPRADEDRIIDILHPDQRYNYGVSASITMPEFDLFRITVKVHHQTQLPQNPHYAFSHGTGKPGGESKEDPGEARPDIQYRNLGQGSKK